VLSLEYTRGEGWLPSAQRLHQTTKKAGNAGFTCRSGFLRRSIDGAAPDQTERRTVTLTAQRTNQPHPRLWNRTWVKACQEIPMKIFSANIEDFRTLYTTHLEKALDMERKIVKALPKMVEQAGDIDLSVAFQNHLEETKTHVYKLEGLLQRNTGEVKTSTCKVIDALSTSAEDTITDVTDPFVLDIALIGAAQEVEHHEIAVYGTLKAWARLLGLSQDVSILESIEAEESKADRLLTALSTRVNRESDVLTGSYR
jgi:ferritin-like metal-binding protein YciE